MKVVFSGGGTLGPVVPLLALSQIIKENYPETEFVWLGTKLGPEKELVEKNNIKFIPISSGKFRRYFSPLNIVDIFRIKLAFFESLFLLKKIEADILITAGGFVSVPVHFAGWFLRIPSWVHQQDIRPGLANKLMSPFAKVVTVTLGESLKKFNKKKVIWLGNFVRKEIKMEDKNKALEMFGLKKELPAVFAMGGGTGSYKINQLIIEASNHLNDICQILHLSGPNRDETMAQKAEELLSNYHQYKFFTSEMAGAYEASDIVISRGGFGSITELAYLSKTVIFIPKTGHQEDNINYLAKNNACLVLDERSTDGNKLSAVVKELLLDKNKREMMGVNLHKLVKIAKAEEVLEVFGRTVKR